MAQQRPTFSESWYRVTNLKARLRGSTQVSRQYYRGDRWYVVRDPAGNQYHRLSSAAYRFVGLLDGTRTVGEAWDLVGGQLADDAPTQPEVIQILSQLHAANLLEADITADSSVLLRRHKKLQKQQFQSRLMNVLFPRIPLWDPDTFLKKWMPVMRLALSRFGALVWLAVVISAIVMLAPRWHELRGDAAKAINFKTNGLNYIWLGLTFVVIKFIHELGHAFTCRRFGGEVHEMGVMFLVFIPAPYVDASSAWSLPNKWMRTCVGAGGMIFELFVAAICAFIWGNTDQNSTMHQLAYNAMLIASVTTVVFNINPLLRYDGYYILSDLLEIPNLRQKSNEYSLGLIKRHLFRIKNSLPLPSVSQRIWLFLYAISSSIYRVFVGLVIILVVSGQVPVLGVLMALGGVVTWLFVPLYKVTNYLLLEPELHRKRLRASSYVVAALSVVVLCVGVLKVPMHFRAVGMVEPRQKMIIHAPYSGFVETIKVRDGDHVDKDQVLLTMVNKELEADKLQLESQLNELEDRIKQGNVVDPTQRLIARQQKDQIKKQYQERSEQVESLQVKAPFSGFVIAPRLNQSAGRFFKPGDEIMTVADFQQGYVVRTIVTQSESALLMEERSGDPEVRLANDPRHSLMGKVQDGQPAVVTNIDPALGPKGGGSLQTVPTDTKGTKLQQEHLCVMVDLMTSPVTGNPTGQRAAVRFTLQKRPLFEDWKRQFLQLLQSTSASNKWL